MPRRGSICLADGDAVVKIAAKPRLNDPIVYGDGVLEVQRQFLDVGVAVVVVQGGWWNWGSRRGRAASRSGSGRMQPSSGTKLGFGCSIAGASRRIGQRRVREGASVGVQTGRVESRIDDPEGVVFRQERVLILASRS